MIVVDTSALMSVVLDEPAAETCSEILARTDEIMISAGTLAEALIVADRRGVGLIMERLISGLGCQVVAVTEQGAFKAAAAYAQWGKGVHRAGLNYSWLRVLGTAEMPQIDQCVGHQFHPVVPLLFELKA